MCFSAQVWADYRKHIKMFKAKIGIWEFINRLERRGAGERINLPKGLTDAFKLDIAADADVEGCRRLVMEHGEAEKTRIETELFAQRRRLADAERKLAVKETKTAANEKGVASNLIAWALGKLDDLRRTEPLARDNRVYSGWYCPVLVQGLDGELLIRPIRGCLVLSAVVPLEPVAQAPHAVAAKRHKTGHETQKMKKANHVIGLSL